MVNKIRLLREDLPDRRTVEKVLVSLLERFEGKISSLEDSRDLTKISLTELMNSLQTQEQRRMLRQEGALLAKSQPSYKTKKKGWKNEKKSDEDDNDGKEKYSVCQYCKKTSHPHWRCWWRPDVVCRSCNQKGHLENVCKRKQQEAQIAQETNYEKDEHLFVATCFASDITSETWLIDSGCTHHMTHVKGMFVKLDKTRFSKVRIGNADYIEVKGIGDIAIGSASGKRLISNVLYVPEIDQNLLGVGQLLEKSYVVMFKDKTCEVFDSTDIKLMSIKMKGKSFSAYIQTDLAYSSADKVGNWDKMETIEKAKKKKSCAFKGRQRSVAINGHVGRSMRIEERPRGQVTKFISRDDIKEKPSCIPVAILETKVKATKKSVKKRNKDARSKEVDQSPPKKILKINNQLVDILIKASFKR